MKIALFFIFSLVLNAILLSFANKFGIKFSLFGRERKIPFTGGLAIFLGFIISFVCIVFFTDLVFSFQVVWFLVFSLLIIIVETVDDLKDLSLKARIFIQVLIVFLFLLFSKRIQIYFLPGWLNYLVSFIWIIGITNAFNLLDIEDGLCGGVSIIVAASLLVIALLKVDLLIIYLLLSLLPSLIVFIFFNFPPARIFMGNAGSHFLGFSIAVFCIQQDYALPSNKISLLIPFLFLVAPIMDTIYLVISRIRNKIHPLRKSPDHIFLHLLSKGYSKRKMLFLVYSVTLLWCMSAITLFEGFNYIFIVLLFLAVFLSVVVYFMAIGVKVNNSS